MVNKMTSRRGGDECRLNDLPDSILSHILSFLPTKDAVRTVLIRRFDTLRTSLPNLDLDDSHFVELWNNNVDEEELFQVNDGFFEFVRNVLRLHQRPTLDLFRVNINTFFFEDIKAHNMDHELESWLTFALRKQVKVLSFGFGMVEPDLELYKLPFTEFCSDSVTELTLEFIEMKLQRQVQMSSLTVLRLIRVELSDGVFREIIKGCPLLEELELYNCADLFEVDFRTASLKKLKFDMSEFGMYGSNRLNCPNVKWLELAACVECLEIIDLSSVVDVTFHDVPRHEFNAFTQFKAALSKLLHCKSVSLSSEYVTVLFYMMMNDLQNLSTNWKRVELKIWLTERHISGICSLLRHSLYIEELVLNVTSFPSHEALVSQLKKVTPGETLENWMTLKRVTIHSNSSDGYGALINLVQVLLKNATILHQMVIYCTGKVDSSVDSELTKDQLADFSEKLQRCPKASKDATVKLVC